MSSTRLAFFLRLTQASICLAAPALAQDSAQDSITFDILDKQRHISAPMPQQLRLSIQKTAQGWEAGVYRGKGRINLLYPQKNWHGAFPCQIEPSTHLAKTFPWVRTLPVRGYPIQLEIDLSKVSAAMEGPQATFTEGEVRVSWSKK